MNLFEKYGDQLGLKLNESEEVELQLIEEELQQIPFNVPAVLADLSRAVLELQRQHIKAAYRLKREALSALDDARNSNNNQMAWKNAYGKAQKADDAIQQVLMYKLQDRLARVNLRKLFFTIIVIMFTPFCLERMFQISPEVSVGWMQLFIKAFIAFCLIRCSISLYLKEITSLFLPRLITQKFLDATQLVGLKLSDLMSGERLADSNSLICNLINSVNNFEELVAIECAEDVPEEMCCAILRTLMTDPVGSLQSRHRFERTAILDWLKIREIHPCTQNQLTSDELTRDFKLKLRIARYVSDKLLLKNVHEYRNKSLVELSIFQGNAQCADGEEDDYISDQMMADSAFGKGSNTYQNLH